jgi:hypothetical protein
MNASQRRFARRHNLTNRFEADRSIAAWTEDARRYCVNAGFWNDRYLTLTRFAGALVTAAIALSWWSLLR